MRYTDWLAAEIHGSLARHAAAQASVGPGMDPGLTVVSTGASLPSAFMRWAAAGSTAASGREVVRLGPSAAPPDQVTPPPGLDLRGPMQRLSHQAPGVADASESTFSPASRLPGASHGHGPAVTPLARGLAGPSIATSSPPGTPGRTQSNTLTSADYSGAPIHVQLEGAQPGSGPSTAPPGSGLGISPRPGGELCTSPRAILGSNHIKAL